MKSLTIGYDAKKIVRNTTGIGNYSRATVNILAERNPENRHMLFASASTKMQRDDMPHGANVEYVYPHGLCAAAPLREWWRCVGVKQDIRQLGVDLYHGLSNELPFGINRVCPSVVTIHDLIFMRYPQAYDAVQRRILEYKTRRACREASRIIAISEVTRRDIVELYGVDEKRIDLVYQGCNDIFRVRADEALKTEARQLYNLPERYIVAVGTLEWRKNQEALVRALPHIKEDDIALVLVGRGDNEAARLTALAQSLGVGARLHILSNVAFKHLPAVYQLAWAGAYVSRIEGFGIPVLEAMVSGLPVVAATGTCLEEAGGPGGIYCAPDDYMAMAAAFNHLLSHPDDAAERVAQGLQYSLRFTDDNIARNLTRVYADALVAGC